MQARVCLAIFDFTVPPTPVSPYDNMREPEPLGAKLGSFGKRQFQFYAVWPMECRAAGANLWSVWTDEQGARPVIVSHSDQGGSVVVIGDTYFATNGNLESAKRSHPDNMLFWRWLLSRVVPGQKPWNPPPAASAAGSKAPDIRRRKTTPKTNSNRFG